MTRIPIKADVGFDEEFHKSIVYFPLVGLIIGAISFIIGSLSSIIFDTFLTSILIVACEVILTGGLHIDGLGDTFDAIYSNRDKERMLEIMKDSHVGSNAVLAIIILLLLKIAAYLELSGETLTWVLLTMSVATRTFMVVFIVNFPYARKEGIGHMFTKYAKPFYTYIAFAVCAGIIAACGLQYLAVAGICFTVTLIIAQYLKTQLGGLTGDTYGALTECGNVIYLLTAVFLLR